MRVSRRITGAPGTAVLLRAMQVLYDKANRARHSPSMVQHASKRGRSINSSRTSKSRYMSVDTKRSKTPIGVKSPYHPDARWKNRVQRTRGFSGKFKGMKRFKLKGRKKKVAQSIEYKYETGGILQDAECVYLGLGSCPMVYLRRCLAACVIKELSKQAQLTFNDWKETPFTVLPVNSVMSVRMYYYANVTSNLLLSVTSTSIAEATGDTWEALLDALSLLLVGNVVTSPSAVVDSFVLRYANGDPGPIEIKAKIEAHDFYASVNFNGNMNVQNVTLASDGIGGETVDITNNPLYGKMYHTSAGNGFIPVSREDFATSTPLTANPATGIISGTAASQLSPNFRKPVPPQVIRKVNRHSNINLNPGEMKRFYVNFAKSHSLTRWFALLGEDFVNQFNYLREGSATMIALEKKLNNRTESNPVIVNYEVNYSFGAYYRYTQKPVTMPIVQIG